MSSPSESWWRALDDNAQGYRAQVDENARAAIQSVPGMMRAAGGFIKNPVATSKALADKLSGITLQDGLRFNRALAKSIEERVKRAETEKGGAGKLAGDVLGLPLSKASSILMGMSKLGPLDRAAYTQAAANFSKSPLHHVKDDVWRDGSDTTLVKLLRQFEAENKGWSPTRLSGSRGSTPMDGFMLMKHGPPVQMQDRLYELLDEQARAKPGQRQWSVHPGETMYRPGEFADLLKDDYTGRLPEVIVDSRKDMFGGGQHQRGNVWIGRGPRLEVDDTIGHEAGGHALGYTQGFRGADLGGTFNDKLRPGMPGHLEDRWGYYRKPGEQFAQTTGLLKAMVPDEDISKISLAALSNEVRAQHALSQALGQIPRTPTRSAATRQWLANEYGKPLKDGTLPELLKDAPVVDRGTLGVTPTPRTLGPRDRPTADSLEERMRALRGR